jgi:sulfofructose kinase
MTPPILCVGIVTWDTLFKVEAIPTAPTKVPALDCVEVGGGMAASAAVAISRLGGRVEFWGRCGDDLVGDRIVADMAAEGVNVDRLRRVAGKRSPISAILVDRRGERLVVPYYDPTLDPSPDWLPVHDLRRFAAVLADVRWPEGAERGLNAARTAGVMTVLDADIAPKDVHERLLPHAEWAVFSEPALLTYAGEPEVTAALRQAGARLRSRVGVTAGADGFYWIEGSEICHATAPTVVAVDTLAAGDVFHGAFTLALVEGRSVAEAARFANVAAALKCTRFGGRSVAPTRAEVEAFRH